MTWEMVPEANRTIMKKLEYLKAAVAYMAKRRFDVVRSFSFLFQIVDPDDDVDYDAIAEAVYRKTGIGTERFPHRSGDTPKPVKPKPEAKSELEAKSGLEAKSEFPVKSELEETESETKSELEANSELEAKSKPRRRMLDDRCAPSSAQPATRCSRIDAIRAAI